MTRFTLTLILALLLGSAGTLRAQADTAVAGGAAVTDAKLGGSVENRMIAQEATKFALGSKVFVWMKVEGAAGDSVTVTWKTGTASTATTLAIGGSPWRTWASKTVRQAGDWTVTLTDKEGKVLKELSFTVE